MSSSILTLLTRTPNESTAKKYFGTSYFQMQWLFKAYGDTIKEVAAGDMFNQEDLALLREDYLAAIASQKKLHQAFIPNKSKLHELEEIENKINLETQNETVERKKSALETFKNEKTITQRFRWFFVYTNWLRLFGIRVMRTFRAMSKLRGKNWKSLLQGIHAKNIVSILRNTDKAFLYIAWVYYLPRLVLNLILFLKHIVPGPWMTEEEKSLGFWTRFWNRLENSWFEIANDSIWATVGLVNCYYLSQHFIRLGFGIFKTFAGIIPAAQILTTVLYLADVIVMGIKYYKETRLNRNALEISAGIQELRSELIEKNQQLENAETPEDQQILNKQIKTLRVKIKLFEQHFNQIANKHRDYLFKKLSLSTDVTIGLLIGMTICLVASFCMPPTLPVTLIVGCIGAAFVVSVCIVDFIRRQQIHPPKTNWDKLTDKLRSFANTTEEISTHVDVDNRNPLTTDENSSTNVANLTSSTSKTPKSEMRRNQTSPSFINNQTPPPTKRRNSSNDIFPKYKQRKQYHKRERSNSFNYPASSSRR